MRLLFALAILIISTAATAEKLDDFLPLGEWEETRPGLQADRRFVDSMVKIAGSTQAAARQLMDKGWEYVRKRDTTRALRRFNQAYLLDQLSAEAYWGLGTVASQMGRPQAALRLLEHAHALQGTKTAALLTDIGFARIQLALTLDADKAAVARELKTAQEWLERAEQLDSRLALIWANRAIIHYYQGEYLAAWRDIERAEALDKEEVDPRIIQELATKMPRPAPSERFVMVGNRSKN